MSFENNKIVVPFEEFRARWRAKMQTEQTLHGGDAERLTIPLIGPSQVGKTVLLLGTIAQFDAQHSTLPSGKRRLRITLLEDQQDKDVSSHISNLRRGRFPPGTIDAVWYPSLITVPDTGYGVNVKLFDFQGQILSDNATTLMSDFLVGGSVLVVIDGVKLHDAEIESGWNLHSIRAITRIVDQLQNQGGFSAEVPLRIAVAITKADAVRSPMARAALYEKIQAYFGEILRAEFVQVYFCHTSIGTTKGGTLSYDPCDIHLPFLFCVSGLLKRILDVEQQDIDEQLAILAAAEKSAEEAQKEKEKVEERRRNSSGPRKLARGLLGFVGIKTQSTIDLKDKTDRSDAAKRKRERERARLTRRREKLEETQRQQRYFVEEIADSLVPDAQGNRQGLMFKGGGVKPVPVMMGYNGDLSGPAPL